MADMETTHDEQTTTDDDPELELPPVEEQPTTDETPAETGRETDSAVVQYTDRDRDVIASVVGQGELNDDEIDFVLAQAKRLGLDVMTKHMHAWKQDGKLIMMVGIDGLRLVARRTGQFLGRDDPEWLTADGRWVDAFITGADGYGRFPLAARVRVHRRGDLHPTTGLALWAESAKLYADGNPKASWKSMPAHMLAKVAEAMALRAAFPAELAGVYTDDEIAHADDLLADRGDPAKNPGAGDETIAALEARLAAMQPETRARLEGWWSTQYGPGVLNDPNVLPLSQGGLHRFTAASEHVTYVEQMIGRAEQHDADKGGDSSGPEPETPAPTGTSSAGKPTEPSGEPAPFTDLEATVLAALEIAPESNPDEIAAAGGVPKDASLMTAIAALLEGDLIEPVGDGRGPAKKYQRNEPLIAEIEGDA
jgi:phage recombination protein Bet